MTKTETEMMSFTQCRPALGTLVKVGLRADADGPYDDDDLLNFSLSAFEAISGVQDLMSFHDPASELSKIHREAHSNPVELSRETLEVLTFALELSRATRGFFDVSVAPELVRRGALPNLYDGAEPSGTWRDVELDGDSIRLHRPLWIDLGGIAKGYAVDRALARIPPDVRATVNAGGDLRMSQWEGENVQIRLPVDEFQPPMTAQLPMVDAAVATSAPYPDGRHPVVNPTNPALPLEPHSVSVFAPNCMAADALTKIAFLVPDCDPLLASYQATAAVFDPSGNMTVWGG